MSMSTPGFSVESPKVLLVVAFLTLAADSIAAGMGLAAALPGTTPIVVLDLVALFMGRLTPLDLSAFVYAMMLAFALAPPFSPAQAPSFTVVEEIDFLATAMPILAYADLSIGLQTRKMKEVS